MCSRPGLLSPFLFFFFNDTATTEIYTLSLHDALPIYQRDQMIERLPQRQARQIHAIASCSDRKSTRLNSSHRTISYAVFCLKKKKKSKNSTENIVIDDARMMPHHTRATHQRPAHEHDT